MRDHKKLKAFQLADNLALQVYQMTALFPKDELFGLRAQMRRSAVSVASNIVEGCARHSESDYLRFIDMAYASSCELHYQASLSFRLGFLDAENFKSLEPYCIETSKILVGLLHALRNNAGEKS